MSYRKFDTLTWQDPWFEALSPQAKLLFIYLWTNDVCNQAGLYKISKRRIEFEVGFKVDNVIEQIRDKVVWDAKRQIIWVKNFVKWQCQNESFLKGALHCVAQMPLDFIKQFLVYNKCLIDRYHVDLEEYGIDTMYTPCPHGVDMNPSSEQNSTDTETENKEYIVEHGMLNAPDPDVFVDTPKENISASKEKIPYSEIISYLNEKANRRFNPNSQATRRLIKARWNEGYQLEDFKRVIDNKCAKWLTDPRMVDYLRPQTLFGTKFEAYLNENTGPPPAEKDEYDVMFEKYKQGEITGQIFDQFCRAYEKYENGEIVKDELHKIYLNFVGDEENGNEKDD